MLSICHVSVRSIDSSYKEVKALFVSSKYLSYLLAAPMQTLERAGGVIYVEERNLTLPDPVGKQKLNLIRKKQIVASICLTR